jgi:hypothetical protein
MASNDDGIIIFVYALTILFGCMFLFSLAKKKKPKSQICATSDAIKFVNLGPNGTYQVVIYRQSGNVHKHWRTKGSLKKALSEIVNTFNRAKILDVAVRQSGKNMFTISRTFYSGRGGREGKKVGWATIEVLDYNHTTKQKNDSEIKFNIGPIVLNCDCGAEAQVEFEERFKEHVCHECGQIILLNEGQLDIIAREVARAKVEVADQFLGGDIDANKTINFR